MAKQKKKEELESKTISISPMKRQRATFCILGTSPIILNRVGQKAKRELLFPKGRKTSAERKSFLKHDPIFEFQDSPYRIKEKGSSVLLGHPASGFKKAMASAAIDLPGDAKKAQVGRLVYVPGDLIGIYGIPKLLLSVVRNSDMNRTPDIRSRAIVPEWACFVEVVWATPLFSFKAVANLLATSGMTHGQGDGRPQKGSLDFGQYTIVSKDDKTFKRIIKSGGYKVQLQAMNNPQCYDEETQDLLDWFQEELKRRMEEKQRSSGEDEEVDAEEEYSEDGMPLVAR